MIKKRRFDNFFNPQKIQTLTETSKLIQNSVLFPSKLLIKSIFRRKFLPHIRSAFRVSFFFPNSFNKKYARKLTRRSGRKAKFALKRHFISLRIFSRKYIPFVYAAALISSVVSKDKTKLFLLRKSLANFVPLLRLKRRKVFLLAKTRRKIVHMWADTKMVLRKKTFIYKFL